MGWDPWALAGPTEEKFAFPGAAELGCKATVVVACNLGGISWNRGSAQGKEELWDGERGGGRLS